MPNPIRAGLVMLVLAAAGQTARDAVIETLERAGSLQNAGDYAAAEKLLLATLKESGSAASTDPRMAVVANDLGSVYHSQDRFFEAERCFQTAIEINRNVSGADAQTARFTFNLAQVYLVTGQHAKAERLDLRALATRIEAADPENPEVSRLFATIGALAAVQRRYGEAESAYKKAVAVWRGRQPEGEEAVQLFNNLGILYQRIGRRAEALTYCERALGLADHSLRPNDTRRVVLLLNVAGLRLTEYGPIAAEPYYQRALSIGENELRPQHQLLGEILTAYAKALQRMKRKSEAKAFERRAKTILQATPQANLAKYTVDIDDLRRAR